jgi:pyruvate,water dikinase
MGAVGRILTLLGLPGETLELMLGLEGGQERPRFRPGWKTYRLLPRMLSFAVHSLRMGPGILPALAEIRQAYNRVQEIPLEKLDEAGLLRQIDQLYAINQKAARLSILVPLLMSFYYGQLRRWLASSGIDIASLDLTQGLVELADYDPNPHLKQLAEHLIQLDPEVRARIAECQSYDDFARLRGVEALQGEIADFLCRFGHICDQGNDFSAVPWRETPGLVLQMVVKEAQRIFEATQEPDKLVINRTGWESLPTGWIKRWLGTPLYRRARSFRLYREAVSATYSYGYGLFRGYFLELGRRLTARDLLTQAMDIFFLRWDEIRMLVQGDALQAKELVAQRKADMLATQDMLLPEIIYGDEMPPAIDPGQVRRMLKGIPSSPGYYRGPIKVIHSVEEMSKLDSGDVLVIPYSDVGWTPLFSRAGAVIAESGGILSHSSIVAREYQIPAVVSVPFAMRLPDQTLVTVDGYRGKIILHTGAPEQAGQAQPLG